jgi:hypothetical protein
MELTAGTRTYRAPAMPKEITAPRIIQEIVNETDSIKRRFSHLDKVLL